MALTCTTCKKFSMRRRNPNILRMYIYIQATNRRTEYSKNIYIYNQAANSCTSTGHDRPPAMVDSSHVIDNIDGKFSRGREVGSSSPTNLSADHSDYGLIDYIDCEYLGGREVGSSRLSVGSS